MAFHGPLFMFMVLLGFYLDFNFGEELSWIPAMESPVKPSFWTPAMESPVKPWPCVMTTI